MNKFFIPAAILAFVMNMQAIDIGDQRMPSPYEEQGIYSADSADVFPPTEPVAAPIETPAPGSDAGTESVI